MVMLKQAVQHKAHSSVFTTNLGRTAREGQKNYARSDAIGPIATTFMLGKSISTRRTLALTAFLTLDMLN